MRRRRPQCIMRHVASNRASSDADGQPEETRARLQDTRSTEALHHAEHHDADFGTPPSPVVPRTPHDN